MSPRHIKSLIESGHYKAEPALVAEAMLQRRGVRTLLTGQVSPGQAGHSRSAIAGGPPAS